MVTYYHGTDKGPGEMVVLQEFDRWGIAKPPQRMLRAGSYVTRHFKDAMKFGYRKAVTNGGASVYLYRVDVNPLKTRPDPKRDRAFILTEPARVELLSEVDTFAAQHKLRRFHLPARHD